MRGGLFRASSSVERSPEEIGALTGWPLRKGGGIGSVFRGNVFSSLGFEPRSGPTSYPVSSSSRQNWPSINCLMQGSFPASDSREPSKLPPLRSALAKWRLVDDVVSYGHFGFLSGSLRARSTASSTPLLDRDETAVNVLE